jgi:hypothetical protein
MLQEFCQSLQKQKDALEGKINHPRPKGRGIRHEVGVDLIAASYGEFDP